MRLLGKRLISLLLSRSSVSGISTYSTSIILEAFVGDSKLVIAF